MARSTVAAIRKSGLSIYASLEDHPELFLDYETLERVLNDALVGLNLDFPLRTRSKVLKSRVCEALGYPTPAAFTRTQPRFPGQNFDTYVQKSSNLQIWNESLAASRRYVLIRVGASSIVSRVRVVTGEMLATLDRTGTLTHKFQAKSRSTITESKLVSSSDTSNVIARIIKPKSRSWQGFLPIRSLYARLLGLVGSVLRDTGLDQERTRGGALHERVCRQLGNPARTDSGQFPDIPEQLLEVKFQTATTIDLGLVCPDSREQLADYVELRHCDVRYAVFYGSRIKTAVRLEHLVVATGEAFFSFFRRFEGKVKNAKLQIPLPSDFFD